MWVSFPWVNTQVYSNFTRSAGSLKEHNIDCLSGHHVHIALRQKTFTFLVVFQDNYRYLIQKIFSFSSGQYPQTEIYFS